MTLSSAPSLVTNAPGSAGDDDFVPVPTYKTVTFLLLFTISFIFTIGLFVSNLYKSLKISTEQKVLFRQASISMQRESILVDLKLHIGKRITSSKGSSKAPSFKIK